MSNKDTILKIISIKGLKTYLVVLVILLSSFLYLQLNGIQLYSTTQTEHEGNNHTYGNNNHK